jgi:adenosylhomocysteine nucleosidase
MIGIIVALNNEANPVIEKISNANTSVFCGKKIVKGQLNGKDVVLIVCGIGKVNSAFCTQILIDKYSVDKIVNFGTVGGLSEHVSVGEYYLIEKCCQYDFDLSDLDDVSVGYIQDYDTVNFTPSKPKIDFLAYKNLATSDKFTCKDSDIETVKLLNCHVFDMEGGAIAEVCTANQIPFYLLKGVVDVHGSVTHKEQFISNLDKICKNFSIVIPELISNI